MFPHLFIVSHTETSNLLKKHLNEILFHSPHVVTSTPASLSTGVVVAITAVIVLIVSVVIGFIAGFITSTLCSHKKAVYSPTVEGQGNIGPTAPAGPVYEDIELNTNKAYGPVRL